MCGIAGIFAYTHPAPPIDRDELLRIREAMINCGPDGAGLWVTSDNWVGLAGALSLVVLFVLRVGTARTFSERIR